MGGRACAGVSTPIANGSLPDKGKTGVIQRFLAGVKACRNIRCGSYIKPVLELRKAATDIEGKAAVNNLRKLCQNAFKKIENRSRRSILVQKLSHFEKTVPMVGSW
jgi:hypothetical protein